MTLEKNMFLQEAGPQDGPKDQTAIYFHFIHVTVHHFWKCIELLITEEPSDLIVHMRVVHTCKLL